MILNMALRKSTRQNRRYRHKLRASTYKYVHTNGKNQAKNESIFRSLADDCGGVFGTLAQAIEELGIPRLKTTRPTPSYKDQLTLGDPEQYDTAMCIDVERYPRTAIRRSASASQYVQRADLSNGLASISSSATVLHDADEPHGELSASDPNGLTAVRNARTYQVDDDSAAGGKRDVTRDELAKGYEYGRTAVHISESDETITNLDTKAALEILGFIPWAKVSVNPASKPSVIRHLIPSASAWVVYNSCECLHTEARFQMLVPHLQSRFCDDYSSFINLYSICSSN